MPKVIVNECRIFATRKAATWWTAYRLRQPDERVQVLTASLGGDEVAILCDSLEDANWLVTFAMSQGVPKSAVAVRA